MMDQYITLGDLLKIGSFLLDLISVILYIYFRQYRTKPACRLCTQSACRFSAILPRNPLPYIKYACGISKQSGEKSDDASYAQALCGIAYNPKIVRSITTKRKRNNRPKLSKSVAVISF